MSELRKAAQQALEHLAAWSVGESSSATEVNDLIARLDAALAQPERKPLTEEEILSVLRLAPPEPSLWPHLKDEAVIGDVQRAVLAIARAVERAHGIGGET